MSHESRDSIDLLELARVIWLGRRLIVLLTGAFLIVGLAYAWLARPWYRAEALLLPAEEQVAPNLLSQFGSIVGLTGSALGTSGSVEPLAVLRSQEFARTFVENEQLMPVLLEDEWDSEAQRWKESDAALVPDWRDAVEYFEDDVRSVSQDGSTGLVTLAIEWPDAAIAAHWANRMVELLNDHMRERALADATANIAYLENAMSATSIVAVQQAIGRLLETELQKQMLARGRKEFAFRVIDPAVEPLDPVRPRRALVALLSLIAGGMVSTMMVIIRHSSSSRSK